MRPNATARPPGEGADVPWLIRLSVVALLLTGAALVVQSVYGFGDDALTVIYAWFVTVLVGGPALLAALTLALIRIGRRKEWLTLTLVAVMLAALGVCTVWLFHLWGSALQHEDIWGDTPRDRRVPHLCRMVALIDYPDGARDHRGVQPVARPAAGPAHRVGGWPRGGRRARDDLLGGDAE
jgi:hypothetical protein